MPTVKQISFVEKNWLQLLVLVAVVILFFNRNPFGCNPKPQPTVVTTSDTTKTRDEQPLVQAPISAPAPTVIVVPTGIPQNYPQIPQASGSYEELLRQFIEMGKNYEKLVLSHTTEKKYTDTIQLKDTSGNRVGVFNYNDLVSENEIKSRQPSYQLSFPKTVITNTTTITQPYIPKNKWFLTTAITGTPQLPVNGAKVGLGWLNKKDQYYYGNFGGQYLQGAIRPQFEIGTGWKITLGKK